jgi:hypothetical protein
MGLKQELSGLGRNWGWKLAALAASTVAWLTFSGSRELSASISAPVQYRNLPRNLDISSEMVEQVHLSLRGPAARLSRVSPESVPVVIDLSGVTAAGERTFPIDEKTVTVPPGIEVDRIVPSQIRLTLEVRTKRQVPVLVRYSRPVTLGVEVIPPALEIVGPESHVDRIDQVQTDPVDPGTLAARGEIQTQAFTGDPQVRFGGSSVVRLRIANGAPKDEGKR